MQGVLNKDILAGISPKSKKKKKMPPWSKIINFSLGKSTKMATFVRMWRVGKAALLKQGLDSAWAQAHAESVPLTSKWALSRVNSKHAIIQRSFWPRLCTSYWTGSFTGSPLITIANASRHLRLGRYFFILRLTLLIFTYEIPAQILQASRFSMIV